MKHEVERSAMRDRFREWVKRNIVDQDPYDDEGHARARYEAQYRFDKILDDIATERNKQAVD